MNLSTWSDKKKVLALFAMIFIVIGIVVTIYLVQRVQDTRSKAAESTVLSLDPATQNAAPGQDATLDIEIDPGQNAVTAVKVTIKFDPTKFSVTDESFALDESTNLKIIEGPVVSNGVFAVSMGIGVDNTTNAITTPQKIGTLNLKVLEDAAPGQTQVTFERADEATIVNSTADTDNPTENVLSNANPATINISGQCVPNVSVCSWDPLEGATSYDYKIINVKENKEFKSGNTTETKVEFSSGVGIEYRCEVVANNDCGGSGEAGVTSETCVETSGTPTPTPTGVVSNTPTPTVTVTPTPTGVVSNTPSPTRTISTPTPTRVILTATPTVPQGGIESPTPTQPVNATTTPTLPPTGNPLVIGGIIGGILILLGGLALLIL